MEVLNTTNIIEYAGSIAAGLLMLVLLLQKYLVGWKADKAEISIITLMHSELERMSEQNTRLSVEMGSLQEEVMELNKQLRTLTVENQRLNEEVTILTGEITRLRAALDLST